MALAQKNAAARGASSARCCAFQRAGMSLRPAARGARVPCGRVERQVVRPVAYQGPQDGTPAEAGKKSISVPVPKLDVDIKQLINWNFLAQLGLTGISWATVFFTSHAGMAAGKGIHASTGILLVGVALAGYSTYLSYQYVLKVKKDGLDVLQGWDQLKAVYDHMTLNFAGAVATLLALQAEVGSLMMTAMTTKAASAVKAAVTGGGHSVQVEALAQAAANTLLAHVVSLILLTLMVRKITDAYKNLLDWGEQLRKSIPGFGTK